MPSWLSSRPCIRSSYRAFKAPPRPRTKIFRLQPGSPSNRGIAALLGLCKSKRRPQRKHGVLLIQRGSNPTTPVFHGSKAAMALLVTTPLATRNPNSNPAPNKKGEPHKEPPFQYHHIPLSWPLQAVNTPYPHYRAHPLKPALYAKASSPRASFKQT